VPSEPIVVTRFGDYTPCITKNQRQVKCFVSDDKPGSPNQGSIEIEPKIIIWGKRQADQVKQFQVNPTGLAHEFTCSKTEAGWFHY
jgi:hypothetical protein